MDKKLIGKWQQEKMGEILNIFDETPLRIKMSATSSGHYNFEPNCVYEKGEYLCFELNDEYYRMVYHIKYSKGHLKGYYTQFGKDTPLSYSLVSEEPEDEPYRYAPPEIYLPESNLTRIELLKQYAAFDRSQEEAYETEYVLGGRIPSILEKYHFSEYVKDTNVKTDQIAFQMLAFVCDHFGHDGSGGLPTGRKVKDIVTFCEKHDGKTNCRGLSLMLASLLRLCSIKARHITCMPYENPFNDCHVVVDCLLPSGKRIMFDPTWRLFFTDSNGEYVSLPHLREMLIAGEPVFANADASRNGTGFDLEYYRNYMTKNTFRFCRGTFCSDGHDDRDARRVELIPKDYPTEKFSNSAKRDFVYNDLVFWEM